MCYLFLISIKLRILKNKNYDLFQRKRLLLKADLFIYWATETHWRQEQLKIKKCLIYSSSKNVSLVVQQYTVLNVSCNDRCPPRISDIKTRPVWF
jgi:hypothetical protein